MLSIWFKIKAVFPAAKLDKRVGMCEVIIITIMVLFITNSRNWLLNNSNFASIKDKYDGKY